jgi:hypothetical protein
VREINRTVAMRAAVHLQSVCHAQCFLSLCFTIVTISYVSSNRSSTISVNPRDKKLCTAVSSLLYISRKYYLNKNCLFSVVIHTPAMFLGAFAKLQKATWLRHVRLSVRMAQLGLQWTDFDGN